jgi:hypothetical protein
LTKISDLANAARRYCPCLQTEVMDQPVSATYDEPTVMWRMRRGNAHFAHAVIGFQGSGAWVMWFVNGRPLGVRDFDDCASAIRWSDRLRAQNWTVGWRLVTDTEEAHST